MLLTEGLPLVDGDLVEVVGDLRRLSADDQLDGGVDGLQGSHHVAGVVAVVLPRSGPLMSTWNMTPIPTLSVMLCSSRDLLGSSAYLASSSGSSWAESFSQINSVSLSTRWSTWNRGDGDNDVN